MSLGRVTWPNLQKSLKSYQAHNSQPNAFKILTLDDFSTYNLYISDLLYRWHEVGSISLPLQYVNGEILKAVQFE